MQEEFHFEGGLSSEARKDGLSVWHAELEAQQQQLAQRLHLPIGHQVELWLRGGVRLRGRLQCAEEMLVTAGIDANHARLAIGRTEFTPQEIESCVRMD